MDTNILLKELEVYLTELLENSELVMDKYTGGKDGSKIVIPYRYFKRASIFKDKLREINKNTLNTPI